MKTFKRSFLDKVSFLNVTGIFSLIINILYLREQLMLSLFYRQVENVLCPFYSHRFFSQVSFDEKSNLLQRLAMMTVEETELFLYPRLYK